MDGHERTSESDGIFFFCPIQAAPALGWLVQKYVEQPSTKPEQAQVQA